MERIYCEAEPINLKASEVDELFVTVKRNARNTLYSKLDASKHDDCSDRFSDLVDNFSLDKYQVWIREQQKQGSFSQWLWRGQGEDFSDDKQC